MGRLIVPMSSRLGYRLAKRTMDLALSLGGIFLLSPLFLVFAALVRIKLGKPIFFRQERAGLHGKRFTIFKFRTMNDSRDTEGHLLPDSERLPPFGQFIRSTSIDELPQLFNVALGEMSLVGPGPPNVTYMSRYSRTQRRRLHVKPGITGWAQVNGRNAVDWVTRLEQDVYYVDNRSILFDLKIIALTIKKVIYRQGISAPNQATMPEFMGCEEKDD